MSNSAGKVAISHLSLMATSDIRVVAPATG